jgi:hypothetical protein
VYCLSEKALPNENSDFSLPGRIEESNSAYFEPSVESKQKSRALVISTIIFAVISVGIFSYYFLNQSEIDSQILDNAAFKTLEEKMAEYYGIGEFGSAHAHAALAVFVDGNQLDFGMPQFQVQSKYIHFENDNPYQIHKHATNVPLHMLFTSLGLEIESDCIHLRFMENTSEKFCADENKSLTLLVNGKPFSSIVRYEIRHDDRILISLGDPESVSEQQRHLESLEIHDVPKKNQTVSGKDISV